MFDFSRPLAILSDVHANCEALVAVLADIKKIGIEALINLGDCIGYGPEPRECADLIQQNCAVNLCGNHDFAALNHCDNFNEIAHQAILFTRGLLRPDADNPDPDALRRWRFLQNLLPLYEQEDFEFMHGSPRRPITEYILPTDPAYEPFKIDDIFAAMAHRYCFIGHTHFPGIIEENNDVFIHPSELDGQTYVLTGRRVLLNVGSVGQPRDTDNRACYAILHAGKITWRRVTYAVAETAEKIAAQPLLDNLLGKRLFSGQ